MTRATPFRVMPGTCERCVWGSGLHAENCRVVRLTIMNAFRDGLPREDRTYVKWITHVGRYGCDISVNPGMDDRTVEFRYGDEVVGKIVNIGEGSED